MIFSRLKRPLLCFAILVLFSGCSRDPGPQTATKNSSKSVTASTPPFPTREPERFRATRIITTTRNGEIHTVTTHLARDGGNRREEDQVSGASVVYLENADGNFIVHPARKLYAQVNGDTARSEAPSENQVVEAPPLDQTRGPATYELLGTEQLGDRQTTKYRVTYGTWTGEATPRSETLIWIDESLGMPIRSETRSGETDDRTTVLTELREIATEVDLTLFRLPGDHKRVDVRMLSRP